jgi:hypothetical protein
LVDAGALELEVVAEGFAPLLRHVAVNVGAQVVFEAKLERTAASVVAPAPGSALAPTQVADAGSERDQVFADKTGGQAPVADAHSGPPSALKWVAGGVAVAGLATGAVLLLAQKSQASQFQEHCQGLQTLPADCRALMREVEGPLWTGSIVALSVGGVFAAVAVVLFVLDAKQPVSEAQHSSACGYGVGQIGVQCQLTF